jgi:hypothetical protein
MSRITIAIVGLLVALTGAHVTSPRAAKTYDLQYKMKEGAGFVLTMRHKALNRRVVMGNEFTLNSNDVIEYDFEVQSAGKEGMSLALVYKNRTHESDMPQIQTPPDFSKLLGAGVRLFLSSKGEMSGFEGFENLPAIEIADMQTTLEGEYYIRELRYILPRLADNPVGIGDRWSHVYEFDEPVGDGSIAVRIDATYTVLGKARQDGQDCLKIGGEYALHVQGEFMQAGMNLVLNMEGEGNETLYFAWKKGMLLASEGSSFIEGTADDKEIGMSIPIREEYDTRLRVVLK